MQKDFIFKAILRIIVPFLIFSDTGGQCFSDEKDSTLRIR